MKFGTGSTTELTQKREGQSTKMPYVRPNIIYINKYPQFSIELPLIVSRSLHSPITVHPSIFSFFFVLIYIRNVTPAELTPLLCLLEPDRLELEEDPAPNPLSAWDVEYVLTRSRDENEEFEF